MIRSVQKYQRFLMLGFSPFVFSYYTLKIMHICPTQILGESKCSSHRVCIYKVSG